MVRDGAFDAEFAEPAIARFTCTSRQSNRSERIAKTYPTTSIRIISFGSIDGRPGVDPVRPDTRLVEAMQCTPWVSESPAGNAGVESCNPPSSDRCARARFGRREAD